MLTVTAGASSWAAVQGGRRIVRRRALDARLARLDVELPMRTEHLTPRLQTLVLGARSTRRVLETPLDRVLSAPRTPWRVGESFRDYDLALTDARRTLWDWMCGLRHLDAADIALLRQLQLDPRPLRSLLYQPGLFDRGSAVFEVLPTAPDLDGVVEGLFTAIEHLRRFEVALLSYRPDPYR